METANTAYAAYDQSILQEVIDSLEKSQKQLPCKLFYDKYGCYLFDRISDLDEYYITRTEISILKENIDRISECIGRESVLIELGSGNSKKIRIILDNIPTPSAYIPVDISEEYIRGSEMLGEDYPNLRIIPLLADYTLPFKLPELDFDHERITVYYPGSTIGNFNPGKAQQFLKRISRICGTGSGLLIGFDLKKDVEILERAYNDESGITADFNLNILRNVNNTLGADFDLGKWSHLAFYNNELGRIEMHLKSLEDQRVMLNGKEIEFSKDETIHTESSYKYSIDEFCSVVEDFYSVNRYWTDSDNKFCILYLKAK